MANRYLNPALCQSYPMNGGDGPHSYIRNSSYQKAAIDSAKEKIREVILAKLDLQNPYFDLNIISIADFGCSVGPNTFDVVKNIIETVKLKHRQENNRNKTKSLEFQVFFNDQTENDFNTLFRTLPPSAGPEYFAAGVPGSFYGRVYPRNSLHIGHTSYTLHWLSRAPEEICHRNSPAWNKNSIQCTNLVQEVAEAYEGQFKKDMGAFVGARAQEVVPGGLMIILGQCLPDGVPMARTWKGVATDMIGDCMIDMAKLGKTSLEKAESFNLPVYFPQISELKEAIEQNGCFSIEMMEKQSHPMEDMQLSNDFIVSMYRAIFHGVIEEHFGEGLVDELFDRFAKRLANYPIDFKECEKDMQYFILLKRNVV